MEKFVTAFCTHTEGSHSSTPVDRFAGVVDDPFSHQVDNAVGEKFGVNTQMFFSDRWGNMALGVLP